MPAKRVGYCSRELHGRGRPHRAATGPPDPQHAKSYLRSDVGHLTVALRDVGLVSDTPILSELNFRSQMLSAVPAGADDLVCAPFKGDQWSA
jgi:hypothetical protein